MKDKSERYCMSFFSALANPIRIKILQCLTEKERNVTELVKNCGFERTLVSHNLATLLNARLISFRKSGKERIYFPNEKIVVPLFFLIENFVCSKCSFRKTCDNLKSRGFRKSSGSGHLPLVACAGCK